MIRPVSETQEVPQLRILGEISARGPKGLAVLGGPGQVRLLAAFLSRCGHVVSTGVLEEALWKDRALPDHPDRALWTAVAKLRRVLADVGFPLEIVSRRSGGYILDPAPGILDAELFDRLLDDAAQADLVSEERISLLDRALELWSGRAFGVLASDSEFAPMARRLEERRLLACEQRAHAQILDGKASTVVADLGVLVAEVPLHEGLRRQQLEALAASGRHGEALRAYDTYRRHLRNELGLDPSPKMQALELRLLRADVDGGVSGSFDSLPIGLSAYSIGDRIGESGSAVVYRAIQTAVGREVAIHVIKGDAAGRPDFIRRFEADIRIVARLEHPAIVPIYDFWREPGRAYVVTRLMRSGALTTSKVDVACSWDRLGQLVRDIGAAIEGAHQVGVVHGSVTADNVLLDIDGNAFLTGFGLGPPVSPTARAGDVRCFALLIADLLVVREQELPSAAIPAGVRAAVSSGFGDAVTDAPGETLRAKDFAERLVDALPVTPKSTAKRAEPNPYRGLRPFAESDAPVFFGREQLVAELVGRLDGNGLAARAILLVGASGSGKSSVVRAGLLPALRANAIPGSADWLVVHLIPGADPFAALADALAGRTAMSRKQLLQDIDYGHGLTNVVCRALPDDHSDLVIVLDQMEELFLRGDDRLRTRFLSDIAAELERPDTRLRLLATLRADLLDRPMGEACFANITRTAAVLVTPLSTEELVAVIVEPARSVGVTVDAPLVAEIVSDAKASPAPLPLLQVALAELYEVRSDGVLDVAGYRKIGGLTGALGRQAEGALSDANHDDASARRLFCRLVSVGEDGTVRRERLARNEVAHSPADEQLIERFGAARLLAFDQSPSRSATVEIAHDALLREWPRLEAWISADLDDLRRRRAITAAADLWLEGGESESDLLRAARLSDAVEWAGRHAGELAPVSAEFLSKSEAQARTRQDAYDRRRANEVRTNRRLRRLTIAVAIVAIGALVAGTVAVQQRRRATENAAAANRRRGESETLRIAAAAGVRLADRPQIALLLAAEAFHRQPGAATLSALQRTLVGAGPFLGVRQAAVPTAELFWADDSKLVVAGPTGTRVILSDAGRVLAENPSLVPSEVVKGQGEGMNAALRLTAAGGGWLAMVRGATAQQLLVASIDDTVARWEVTVERPLVAIVMSSDGASIAAMENNGRLTVFDISDGKTRWSVDAFPERNVKDVRLPAGTKWTELLDLGEIAGGRVGLSFAPGNMTVVATFGPIERQWSAATGGRVGGDLLLIEDHENGPEALGLVSQVALSPGRDIEAVVARLGVSFFSPTTGQLIAPTVVFGTSTFAFAASVLDIAWKDDSSLVALTNDSRLVELTVSATGATSTRVIAEVHLAEPTRLAVSPSAHRVAVASREGVGVWALDGDSLLADGIPRHHATAATIDPSNAVIATTTSPVGSFASRVGSLAELLPSGHVDEREVPAKSAVGVQFIDNFPPLVGVSEQIIATTWSPNSGEELAHFGRRVWSAIAVDSQQRSIAFGRREVSVFDVRRGVQIGVIRGFSSFIRSLSFSADGRRLAVAESAGPVRVYDTTDWAKVGEIAALEGLITYARFAPNGRQLVTIVSNGTVQIRDAVTFRILQVLLGVTNGTSESAGVWFSTDSRYLMTSGDGSARLWDMASASQIGDPFPNEAGFGLDGNDGLGLVTAGPQTLALWRIDPDTWPAIACAAAGRNLSAAEWTQFGPVGEPYDATCPQWPTGH